MSFLEPTFCEKELFILMLQGHAFCMELATALPSGPISTEVATGGVL